MELAATLAKKRPAQRAGACEMARQALIAYRKPDSIAARPRIAQAGRFLARHRCGLPARE